jgi:hypothetical protein
VHPRWCKASVYLVFIILGLECDESLRTCLVSKAHQQQRLQMQLQLQRRTLQCPSSCGIPRIFLIVTDRQTCPVHSMSAFAKWTLLVVHHPVPSSHAE